VPIDPLDPSEPSEPSEPSGDVGPIAGVLIAFCACPAPQLIKSAAVMTSNVALVPPVAVNMSPMAGGH
jgi:hypothetical protein